MNKLRLPITLAFAAMLASGVGVAGEIYKWVDDDGNVHYEDRPTGNGNSTSFQALHFGDLRHQPALINLATSRQESSHRLQGADQRRLAASLVSNPKSGGVAWRDEDLNFRRQLPNLVRNDVEIIWV